jgi:hypothetical protein
MFVTLTTPTRWPIHDLGELSNVSVDGRPETIFFGKDGEQVECHNARTEDEAADLAADLNARTRKSVQDWIKDNKFN